MKSVIFLFGVYNNAAYLLYYMKWDVHRYNWNCTFHVMCVRCHSVCCLIWRGFAHVAWATPSLPCVVRKTLFMELGGCCGRLVCVMVEMYMELGRFSYWRFILSHA